jgi:eukaryotic-like serine/threonine-protein kinase
MINDGDRTQSATDITVGRYHLLRQIGKGGMGEVWLGEDPRLHRQVAIKTLPLQSQGDQEFLQRFEREARAAAALNHPHILPVHDYGQQLLPNGQALTYIVMPYVSGGTLANRIALLKAHQTLMPYNEIISYLLQAAEAIDYAHSQRVLHRDIKPTNMLLRSDNWLLLADFGIARILAPDEAHLTRTGVGIGTPEYMAPEQAQGKAEAVSDNYSLAVIAYQLFTGQVPFRAETPYAITIQHIMTPPPPPRQLNPNLSPAVERVLLYGLAKDPIRRPPSAQAFVAELQHALTDVSYEATFITPSRSEAEVGEAPTLPSSRSGVSIPPTQPASSSFVPGPNAGRTSEPARGLTRRQALIGGAAAVALAGGLGVWAVASRFSPSTQNVTSNPTPTHNPNLPLMTLVAHTQPISSLAWAPAVPLLLASAGKDGQVMLWDIQALQQGQSSQAKPKARQQFKTASTSGTLLGWSSDGANLAIGNANEIVESNGQLLDTQADIYKSDLSRRVAVYDDKLMTFYGTSYTQALTWTPGKYLTTISHPHKDTGTGEYLLEFRDPLQPQRGLLSFHQYYFGYAVAASPDGSTVAVGTGVGVMVGHPSGTGSQGHWNPVPFDVPQSQAQQLQQAYRSTVPPGTPIPLVPSVLRIHNQFWAIGAVTWSASGQYIAAIPHPLLIPKYIPASQIAIWDWQSKQQLSISPSLPNPKAILTTLEWSLATGNSMMAAGSKDGVIYVWNVDPKNGQGNTLPVHTFTGPNANVTTLAWSADGQWLAAGYDDTNNSILVWKIV